MERLATPTVADAIKGLHYHGLSHLNGFFMLLERDQPAEGGMCAKTRAILIRVFTKEIELLVDASQFCFSGMDLERKEEMESCIYLLRTLIDQLSEKSG